MNTQEKDKRAAWLDARRAGIGGSDIGAIMGVPGAFSSPLSIFNQKLGIGDSEDSPADFGPLTSGRDFEAAILDRYTRATGNKIAEDAEGYLTGYYGDGDPACRVFYRGSASYADPGPTILQSVQWPFLLASIDAVAIGPDDLPIIVDAKFHDSTKASAYKDAEHGVPEIYYLQVQHYLAVTGLQRGAIAAQFGNRDFKAITFERDEDTIARIVEAAKAFAERVASMDPPDPIGHADEGAALALAHPRSDGEIVALDGEGADDLETAWAEAKATQKEVAKLIKLLESEIKAKIGDHEGLQAPSGGVWTWKPQERARSLSGTSQDWAALAAWCESTGAPAEVAKIGQKAAELAEKGPTVSRVLRHKKAKK